jgi:bacillithiol biosynthesis cysteine-adding enzyme BshC
MYLNFSDIPGHQNLFLDYLHEFENVERFYERNFRAQETYKDFFQLISHRETPHRDRLVEIIKQQYSDFKSSKQTQSNIEALASNKTIAVLTGQQLGLFGGPLYTIYKTITAIKLCNYLKEKYDEFQFVPVFWLEGDDHDYDEVRVANILNNENQILQLEYSDGLEEETNRGSVAELKFNENLENTFAQLTNGLRDTEFRNSIIDFYRSFYSVNKSFLESFRELMIKLFDEFGLVVFNPVFPAVKQLLKPIFTKEITNYMNQTGFLVERSAELEELYHAQVKVKPINLFYLENNERLLIEPVEKEYRLKGKRKKFTQEEILEQVEHFPEKFSPNVLLRPICQDYLFPTGFYIGGPSEVSYFAQISPLYKIYDIKQPYIYPRSSATIVEKGAKSVLDKYSLGYVDIFTTEEEMISKIVSANSKVNLEELFQNAAEEIANTFAKLNSNLKDVDKTLPELANKTLQRIDETINVLKNKALDAEKRKYETTIRQLTKVRNLLYPNTNLQERELNFIYFANKYGLDIIKWIYNELSINKFEHQILELP